MVPTSNRAAAGRSAPGGPTATPDGPAPPVGLTRALVVVLAVYVVLYLMTGLGADLVGRYLAPVMPAAEGLGLIAGLLLLLGTSLQAACWLAAGVLAALVVARGRRALRTAGVVALVAVLTSGLLGTRIDVDAADAAEAAQQAGSGLWTLGLVLDAAMVAGLVIALAMLLRALRAAVRTGRVPRGRGEAAARPRRSAPRDRSR